MARTQGQVMHEPAMVLACLQQRIGGVKATVWYAMPERVKRKELRRMMHGYPLKLSPFRYAPSLPPDSLQKGRI
jgi:hypothetical protein